MPIIVIAYKTTSIDGIDVRIYDDATEKYFEDEEDKNTKDYIEYVSKKGYTVDVSPIKIYAAGEFDADALLRAEALSKLTDKEKEILGV